LPLLGLFMELVSGSVSGKSMDHTKNDFDEEDLYYEYVKRRDGFIPYRKMYEREEERLEIHSFEMASLEAGIEWEWRKELARRAHERSIKWSRRHHAHVFIREDHV